MFRINYLSWRAICMTLAKYDLDIGFTSRQPWSHFKIHCHTDIKWYRQPKSNLGRLFRGIKDGYFHLVFGKLSIVWDNWTLERYAVCGNCNSSEIGEVSAGDEGWTVCPDCRTVEGSYKYLNKREYEAL